MKSPRIVFTILFAACCTLGGQAKKEKGRLAFCSQRLPFEMEVLTYEGNKVAGEFVFEGKELSTDSAGTWRVKVDRKTRKKEATDYVLTFEMKEGSLPSCGVAVRFDMVEWDTANYLFAPAAVYGGNRFRILPVGYPPFIYDPKERPLGMPITTTNVPHLNRDGTEGRIELMMNSCATPLVGYYDKVAKRGFFLLTQQDTILGNSSFTIHEVPAQKRLSIRMSAPGVREHRYTMCNANTPSDDKGIPMAAGQRIAMAFRIYDFPCESLMAYFDRFLSIRKTLSGQNEYRNLEPFSSIASTIFKHHLANKWYEDEQFGYVCNKPMGNSYFGHLSVGWNGVPAFMYALSSPDCPDREEVLRRFGRHMNAILYMQGESGLFGAMMKRGQRFGDGYKESAINPNVSFIRRQGCVVYLGLRCLDMLKQNGLGGLIKPEWEAMIRKAADALCALYERYGEFGEVIDAGTGEIYTPNSTGGARCITALTYAAKYFDNPRYLEMAEKAGQHYYDLHLSEGYVGGAPGDILQSPDSEASADLLDAYVALYEITRNEKWLGIARSAAAYFSSWVVSYDYKFPEASVFGRHGVKAAGSVWASVQNEHSAPGIYVMSGDFLFKLFRATSDRRYLELDKDIVHNVVQYVNTEGNRIQSRGGFGFVTERVNIGDWEGAGSIGMIPQNDTNIDWEQMTVFKCVENPGIYVQPDKGEIWVLDHVDARIVSSDGGSITLEISNPTYRDGEVSVLAETSDYARGNSLGWNAFQNWPKVHVPSGGTVTVTLPVAR